MGLLFVGPRTKKSITCIASHGDYTFTACGSAVLIYKRALLIGELNAPIAQFGISQEKQEYGIVQMLVVGELLMTVCDDNVVRIFNHTTGGNRFIEWT